MPTNVLKCQLAPINRASYLAHGVVFTDAEFTQLSSAFPTGVCDWSKPGVAQQAPAGFWLDYTSTVGGTPLPAAPVSVPFDESPTVGNPGRPGAVASGTVRPAVPATVVAGGALAATGLPDRQAVLGLLLVTAGLGLAAKAYRTGPRSNG